MNKYKVIKRLNHNVVMCFDESNKEVILFGKGLGFDKNVGDFINKDNIEKIYEIKNKKDNKNYQELAIQADEKIFIASEEIISKMVDRFGNTYNEKLHVSLLDHLMFSVKRYRDNIPVGNFFLEEIEYLYPKEYKFSVEMLNMLNNSLNIKLPDSEAGFICMHIHSSLTDGDSGLSAVVVKIIGDCTNIIEEETSFKLEESGVLKQRLITHLKFAIKRAIDGIKIDNPIESVIKEKYEDTYNLASKIGLYIEKNYGVVLNEGEIGYLTIHLQNIINSSKSL